MPAYLNELALAEARATSGPAHLPIDSLLEFRQPFRSASRAMYCTQSVLNASVDETRTLADIGRTLPGDLIGPLFQWLVIHGPFTESDRNPLDNDLFHFETTDVPDLGLGEVARRILSSEPASAYSPIHASTSKFANNPLQIVRGMVEEPTGLVDAPNYIDAMTLANALATATPETV